MAKTRQQKQDSVKQIQEKLGKARSVVFADYKGLTMKQLSDLRSKLYDQQAEFTITKNTLLQRAVQSINYPLREASPLLTTNTFDGPTAVLLSYDDQITPIKILVKALKDAALGKVKSGFLGRQILDETTILQLATLPTKDELREMIVGVLVAPLQGMVGMLQANLRNLVYALDQIKLQRGGV